MDNIEIQVFGSLSQPVDGYAKCGSESCESIPTTGDQFLDLIDYLNASDIKDKVAVNFIDLGQVDIDKYQNIKQRLNRGISPPIVLIANEQYHYGISKEHILDIVREMLDEFA